MKEISNQPFLQPSKKRRIDLSQSNKQQQPPELFSGAYSEVPDPTKGQVVSQQPTENEPLQFFHEKTVTQEAVAPKHIEHSIQSINLTTLPQDVLNMIISYINDRVNLLAVAKTCKRFNLITKLPDVINVVNSNHIANKQITSFQIAILSVSAQGDELFGSEDSKQLFMGKDKMYEVCVINLVTQGLFDSGLYNDIRISDRQVIYNKSAACILICDLNIQYTCDSLKEFMRDYNQHSTNKPPVILIGTRTADQPPIVTPEELNNFALQYGIKTTIIQDKNKKSIDILQQVTEQVSGHLVKQFEITPAISQILEAKEQMLD